MVYLQFSALLLLASALVVRALPTLRLSDERVVFQLETGDIELAFYPEIAPETTAHIFKCVQMGLYTTNHFFRVHPGFVAQTADCAYGRTAPLSPEQKELAQRTVPFEWVNGVSKHAEASLSLAKGDDPHSGGSSFSVMLAPQPGLDTRYAVFGKVTRGMDVVHALEKLETKTEGIFVMPLKRIPILATYWYLANAKPMPSLGDLAKLAESSQGAIRGRSTTEVDPCSKCTEDLNDMKQRYQSLALQVEDLRRQALP